MSKRKGKTHELSQQSDSDLFERVVAILDQARRNVVRSVNTNRVLAYWDVGQVDGYARLFEDRLKVPGDNPTIGLIPCSDRSEAVAKYSVLSEGQQIFASKYLQFLPSEQELTLEIERERNFIEAAIEKAIEQEQQA